ncbi:AIPR family protein [Streptomyces sp. NBC_00118]|uniref:AIPR family protein n=1 Tax=Streptomyces sp. NBC_00118 TaxID=2975658 RepID=UPI00308EBBD5|nr:AIPR family protein [Streptomyces sp. NBC_01397]
MADTAPPLGMRQVREHLLNSYRSILDMSDFANRSGREQDSAFYSRALAAETARILTSCDAEEAADAVVDGPDDHGIDAVIISPRGSDIWFIQAKWSEQARARISESDALKMLFGLRQVADRQYDGFNSRIRALSTRIDSALSSPQCRVNLVLALATGDGRLTQQAEERLVQAKGAFGFKDRTALTIRALGLADFHSAARAAAPAPVRLSAHLTHGWYSIDTPYRSWVGSISAGELASWYESHGPQLFDPHLRRDQPAQPRPDLVEQLVNQPEEFWYLNNGITLLCDHATTHYFARKVPGHPMRLELDNARITNGAQTTAAVTRAVRNHPEAGDLARVSLRIICLDDAPAEDAAKISRAAGSESQLTTLADLAADDPHQKTIRNEMIHFLNKRYAYQHGELVPAPATGCTVQEAALALACAHPDATVIAKAAVPTTGKNDPLAGLYDRLFGEEADVPQIWQNVLLLRQTRTAVAEAAVGAPAAVQQVIEHGELFIAYLLFQDARAVIAETRGISSPSSLPWLSSRTRQIVEVLTDTLERLYGVHVFLAAVFTDPSRCKELAADLKRSLADQPFPSDEARPPSRRPNSVSVLVAHRRLTDGTRLMFQPSRYEEEAIGEWLREDPSRYLATWTNDSRRPLIWAVDGQAYSPSGLVMSIWQAANWEQAPPAVQGATRWVVPGEGSLSELAAELVPTSPHNDSAL